MSPHDEEHRSTDEAELYGAGEEERCTVLNQLEKLEGPYSSQALKVNEEHV